MNQTTVSWDTIPCFETKDVTRDKMLSEEMIKFLISDDMAMRRNQSCKSFKRLFRAIFLNETNGSNNDDSSGDTESIFILSTVGGGRETER
jgi:hypothetical protein